MKHLIYIMALSLFSVHSMAFPKAPFNALEKSFATGQKSVNAKKYDFEAIVKLDNCSGSVIRFIGQSLDDKAYVLTNGHCLGRPFLKPGQIAYKKNVWRRMKVADTDMNFFRVTAIELVYGTMTDTDAAIYKLKETYRDLLKWNIKALELSNQRPSIKTEIEIISGYWERGYACKIDQFIHMLKEDAWTFTDSIRYTDTGCDTIGGTSGSPIIEKGTKTVIGVNNTGNESGRKCTMNNPCEVDENNVVTAIKGASYGQQTYQFYSCLDEKYEINLSLEGCTLPK